ncbi:single-stranded-DNA-specific exonuclease RecJ [Thalassobacillus devorans]|uniref:Single-stranded-DNA-specific exonuclease RecJ n=1 Tax=Thalassobacillus devorans TaxID=279813 RepID=A0ABQ1P7H7_9BACI|nr:single-stranded-DNA-specific exonuclease RecJ [Thalassobacillus devorans]NIK29766.1 single-stranded-DNA-specific exonuclease [Thalassobacillus devorans]GGC92643.1 single-stranded-DNA-specific exonuclease RecJ [Thalassobacillus devorans]
MLKSKLKWNFTYNDEMQHDFFFDDIDLSPLTSKLLWRRNITDSESAERFLFPSLDHLHDPFLMEGMKESVERVRQAIKKEENILVFGDYDADGVSATSVMVEALREAGADCDFYIPNRFTEGYGPNEEAFRKAKENGIDVIITVDTGIAAVHEAEVAKELGMDLIITDHHEVQEELPAAYAIIHPKASASYPFQELAGVGVAFKFAQALLGRFPKEFLDLVVIGTIADLVPLKDENRVLASFGLKAISQSPRPGIQALKKICGIDGDCNEETIGFQVGPRINAVGRLQDASPAVDLLLTREPEEAEGLAKLIDQLNKERQKIVSDIAEEAEKILEADESGENDSVIVVAKPGWNPGVLGIVASRLVGRFDRPAIVLGIDEETGEAKGSARSIDAFDLFVNCMKIRGIFKHFGGHAQAAGMTLKIENINELRRELNRLAAEQLTPDDFTQSIDIENTIDIEMLSLKQLEEIDKLSPFGMGNPKPIFHIEHAPKEIRQIGSKQNHLKFQFNKSGTQLDGIAFGMGELYRDISPSSKVEAIGELGINEWNGRKKLQIMIKDIRIAEWQLFDYRGSKYLEKKLAGSNLNNHAALTFEGADSTPFGMDVLDKHTIMNEKDRNLSGLVVLDLPARLDDLAEIIRKVQPEKIYACYRLDDSAFFEKLPTREDFKWFYGMLMKHKTFELSRDASKLASYKGWSKDTLEFISQVFFELDFVRIENGLISLHPSPSKKDLNDSDTYQLKQRKLQVEKKLYYSNYQELKSWFDQYMEQVDLAVKEEVTYGL